MLRRSPSNAMRGVFECRRNAACLWPMVMSHSLRGKSPKPFKDITGHVYGRLRVKHRHQVNTSDGSAQWVCFCDPELGGCGKVILTRSYRLSIGRTKSCGCHRKDIFIESNTRHDMPYSPEYGIWENIKQRCFNPNNDNYGSYGGRGITMCSEWKNDFMSFYTDMGPRPSPDLEIDRIDNDGGYCKSNCRWATRSIQVSNTRRNRYYTYKGVKTTITEIAKQVGINVMTLKYRLNNGRSLEDAIAKPIGRKS